MVVDVDSVASVVETSVVALVPGTVAVVVSVGVLLSLVELVLDAPLQSFSMRLQSEQAPAPPPCPSRHPLSRHALHEMGAVVGVVLGGGSPNAESVSGSGRCAQDSTAGVSLHAYFVSRLLQAWVHTQWSAPPHQTPMSRLGGAGLNIS